MPGESGENSVEAVLLLLLVPYIEIDDDEFCEVEGIIIIWPIVFDVDKLEIDLADVGTICCGAFERSFIGNSAK